MRKIISIIIFTIISSIGCSGQIELTDSCAHSHICCDVKCFCCPHGTFPLLTEQNVIKQIDSIKFIKEMPYICETGICGDNLYWKAVRSGYSGIELLIDKLDDTTSTKANVVLFSGNYTVADIAFNALSEIIHNIPTFELLGVPFDKDGCGYCSYWQHLNKDFSNRQKFEETVRNWYRKNKDNFVWVSSNDFATCDCKGNHPNGGHFKLKTDTK